MLGKKKNILKKILYFILIVGILILGLSISNANAKYVIATSYEYSTDVFCDLITISEYKGCTFKGNIFNKNKNDGRNSELLILMDCPENFDYEKIFEIYYEVSQQRDIKIPRDLSLFL